MTDSTRPCLGDLTLRYDDASQIRGGHPALYFIAGGVASTIGAVIGVRWNDIKDALDTGITEQDVRDAFCEATSYCPTSRRTRRRTIRGRRRLG